MLTHGVLSSTRARAALIPVVLAGLAAALLPAPSTAEPTWLLPAVTLGDPGFTLNSPDVAIGPSGTAVAVWTESNWKVRSAVRPRGGAWIGPADLVPIGNNPGSPVVAVGPDGRVFAAWCSTVAGDQVIEVAESADGKTWGASKVISAGDTGLNSEVLLVVGPTGEATAVWDTMEGANPVLAFAVRPAGGGWAAAATLTPGTVASRPDLAVDDEGVVTALWTGYTGLHHVIRAANRQPGGGWSGVADVSDPAVEASLPDLATGPAGVLTATWVQGVAPAATVEVSTRASTGAWTASTTVSETPGTLDEPAVAVGADGAITVAWVVEATGQRSVGARSRPADGGWGPVVPVSVPVASAQQTSLVATPGGAILVWVNGDAERQATAARRTPSGTWTSPVPLSVAGSQTWNPDVAVDAHGDAVAVWQRAVGSNAQYEAVGLDGSGPTLGTPVIPATAYAGKAVAFAASPTDAWSAVSTSWSFGDGASWAGTNATHAFATRGTYAVTVTATDAVGNSTSATGQVTVTGKPVLRKVKLSKSRIHPRADAPGKTRLRLTLSTAAEVRVKLVRDKSAAGKGRVVARIVRSLGAGRRSIVIRGKVNGKLLKSGRYDVRVVAVNPAGRSKRVERRLVVVS